jgi:spoIIIJ-associated protein
VADGVDDTTAAGTATQAAEPAVTDADQAVTDSDRDTDDAAAVDDNQAEDAPVADAEADTPDSVDDESDESAGSDQSDQDEDSDDDDESDDDESDEDDEDGDDESDPLDVEGEVAADYLEELLDIADLDGDIDTYVENGRAHVSVITESDVLVGANGEVLEALQELARLAVVTETGSRSRLMLDIAGYRDRRRKALTDLATDAVQEVKDTGEAVRLKPMNPFERKIVHDVVADAGLTSESEGEEPQRRVVIQPNA